MHYNQLIGFNTIGTLVSDELKLSWTMLKNSQKLCIKNLNRLKDQHFAPVSNNLKCLLIARVEEVGLRSLKIRHNK